MLFPIAARHRRRILAESRAKVVWFNARFFRPGNQGVKRCCSGKTSQASGARQAASLAIKLNRPFFATRWTMPPNPPR
jgi:hypothetical protein